MGQVFSYFIFKTVCVKAIDFDQITVGNVAPKQHLIAAKLFDHSLTISV